MATLPGQRAQFTWALNEYNKTDDPAIREKFAKLMARTIAAAPTNGFSVDQVTQKQIYPEAEVSKFIVDSDFITEPGLPEEQAQEKVKQTVDISEIVRIGEGSGVVYVYGYRCCPDRLKIGSTEVDAIQRIATQIGTSTPDKLALFVEIKTNTCRIIERAMHNILEARGRKILGGGDEWFLTAREEVLSIYEFIKQT